MTPRPDAQPDAEPSSEHRSESPAERMDRHWAEILQELRVAQTGVQILFAFLLILPFQARFTEATDLSHTLYVTVVCLVAVSTILNLAPVITHRFLYTKHKRDALLRVSDLLTKASFVFLGLSLLGAVLLAIDMVLGQRPAFAIVGALGLLVLILWVVIPTVLLTRSANPGND